MQAELEKLESQGIIAPVTEPTEWCAPIVVAPKKDSEEIQMCVNLSDLNKYVKREWYFSPTPAEAVADIAANNAVIFTKIDRDVDCRGMFDPVITTRHASWRKVRHSYNVS